MQPQITLLCFTCLLLANRVTGKPPKSGNLLVGPKTEQNIESDFDDTGDRFANGSRYSEAESDYDEEDGDDVGSGGEILESLRAATDNCGAGDFIYRGQSAYPCRRRDDGEESYNGTSRGRKAKPFGGHPLPGRIASGFEVAAGLFPSYVQLSIQSSLGGFTCGGTLISNRIVLTAAHCFGVGGRQTFKFGRAYLGGIKIFMAQQEINIARACVSPTFTNRKDGRLLRDDFAVIILEKNAVYTRVVKPACFGARLAPHPEAPCFEVGMGRNDKEYPTQDLYGLPVKLCPGSGNIGDPYRSICYKSYDHRYFGTACEGDSGGPLYCLANCGGVVTQVVAGHVSQGTGSCRYGHRQFTWHADYRKIGGDYDTLIRNCANNIGTLPRY